MLTVSSLQARPTTARVALQYHIQHPAMRLVSIANSLVELEHNFGKTLAHNPHSSLIFVLGLNQQTKLCEAEKNIKLLHLETLLVRH